MLIKSQQPVFINFLRNLLPSEAECSLYVCISDVYTPIANLDGVNVVLLLPFCG
jgi:hypothetical protein